MKSKTIKISLTLLLIVFSFTIMLPVLGKNLILIDSTGNKSVAKLKDNRPNRPVFHNIIPSDFESFMFKMSVLKSSFHSNPTNSKATVKTSNIEVQSALDQLKIYPNPVTDQLNLTYNLKKESNVNIKLLDVLGNEIMILLSKKVPAGEQTNTFYLDSKLSSGFYFVRVTVDSESMIKRISVL
ncbi:MAG: T9SS type A sorting domain-containing protein [Sphingobacteriales bacterium]|nr:T9SS type A sorting domain-containing protein [Sphingobacteriales bacterium]